MKIEIGQDALRRWAWMVRDEEGRLVASGDDYYDPTLAMEAALNRDDDPGKGGRCSKS